jgi:hypothetical protein
MAKDKEKDNLQIQGEEDIDEREGVLEPHWCPCLPFDIYPWLILLSVCFVTFGSYWVYDTPGAIYKQLK